MALRFNGQWRFAPPPDGQFINSSIPTAAVWEFAEIVKTLANQAIDRWAILELFKGAFGVSSTSSSESWAEYDLDRAMEQAALNAPVFIEQLINGFDRTRKKSSDWFVPDVDFVNAVLAKHKIGYELRLPDLLLRDSNTKTVQVSVPEPSLADRARELINRSLSRAEELLLQKRPREAVQESLWLLETVTTAFRGLETESGRIEGKYFNQIVKNLSSRKQRTTLKLVLGWIEAMHGYLSSPTGGGIRHGLDLDSGIELSQVEGQLFCNLTRSYVQFLLHEYDAAERR
jgi:hypothetical protein